MNNLINYSDNYTISNGIEYGFEQLNTLLSLYRTVSHTDELSVDTSKMLYTTLESMSSNIVSLNISNESLLGINGKSIALENIGVFFSAIWNAVKATLTKIWEFIEDIFSSSESSKVDEKIKTLKPKIKKTVDEIKKGGKTEEKILLESHGLSYIDKHVTIELLEKNLVQVANSSGVLRAISDDCLKMLDHSKGLVSEYTNFNHSSRDMADISSSIKEIKDKQTDLLNTTIIHDVKEMSPKLVDSEIVLHPALDNKNSHFLHYLDGFLKGDILAITTIDGAIPPFVVMPMLKGVNNKWKTEGPNISIDSNDLIGYLANIEHHFDSVNNNSIKIEHNCKQLKAANVLLINECDKYVKAIPNIAAETNISKEHLKQLLDSISNFIMFTTKTTYSVVNNHARLFRTLIAHNEVLSAAIAKKPS